MDSIKVGVIRGGPSSEYNISLKTGGEVLKHLPAGYVGSDILLSKEGQWYLNGFPKKPAQIFDFVDIIFNALHGEFGEDGKVQHIFESASIPFTGSEAVASALAMNKHLGHQAFKREGIKFPKGIVFKKDSLLGFDSEECAQKVFNAISPPWVTKPASAGSSVGVKICNGFFDLMEGIENAFKFGSVILVEEFIKGREATCGVLNSFRGEKIYALPVVEIIPPENRFFDYQVKYNGSTQEVCPANFDLSIKKEIENIAKRAHQALGCRHYSRADFIVNKNGIYLLEVNTLPGLTSESLLPKAAAAAGLYFQDLLDHLLQLALNKK